MATNLRYLALGVAILGAMLIGVESHGSLTIPRSRNVISPINSESWWKDHGNGHGGVRTQAGPKPAWGPGECSHKWSL